MTAERWAAARDDRARLGVAFDAWRTAVAHLHRRRVPKHLQHDKDANKRIADRLLADMVAHLMREAERIDRGEYDAG
jgi:hypothetical protein